MLTTACEPCLSGQDRVIWRALWRTMNEAVSGCAVEAEDDRALLLLLEKRCSELVEGKDALEVRPSPGARTAEVADHARTSSRAGQVLTLRTLHNPRPMAGLR